MATFNPDLQPTNDPSYLNQPKEYSSRDFPIVGSKGNKEQRLNDLFSGLANLVKGGVKAAENVVKENIRSDVYEGTDALRGAQGVDLTTNQAAAGGEALNLDRGGNPNAKNPLADNKPPQPDVVQSGIARLQAAYDQGKISDTNYYAQLEAMTRAIRSRYPGFREEVDQMVHSVTGITPANALRSSLLRDMEQQANAKDAAGKEYRHFVTQNQEYLPADFYDRAQSGKPYDENEIYGMVKRQKSEEHRIQAAGHALDLEAKQGKKVEDSAEKYARDKVSTLNSNVISRVEPFINKVIEDQAKGIVYTPEQQNEIRAQANQLRSTTLLAIDKAFNEPTTPGGKTLNTYVDSAKKKAIIDDQMRIFDMVDQHLFDKDKGVLNTALNSVKAMTESDNKAILEKYPAIRIMTAVGSVPGGAKVLEQLATRPESGVSKTLSTQMNHLFQSMAMSDVTGGQFNPNGKTSMNEQLNDVLAIQKGKKPSTIKAFIDSKVGVLINPALPTEAKAKAVESIFGRDNVDFLKRFVPKDQLSVYQSLVSPQVTQEMAKLKGTPAWDSYSHWAKNAFITIYRQAGDNVGKAPDSPYWKVSFNERTRQFELSPTPEGVRFVNSQGKAATGFSVIQALSRLSGADISSNIERLNAGIRSIKPVLVADGHSTSEEVKKLTNFMSQYDQKNPTFWQWIMKGATPAKEDLPPEKQSFGGIHPNFTPASGGNESTRGGLLSITNSPTEAADAIKATFSKGESGDDYNRLVNLKGFSVAQRAPLTSMSVAEVLSYQEDMMANGHPSTAAGKYQIIRGTLRSLVKEGVVSLNDKYDEANQEKLANALLERRGLTDFQEGKIPVRKFLQNLGDEWEIIKVSPKVAKSVIKALQEQQTASK